MAHDSSSMPMHCAVGCTVKKASSGSISQPQEHELHGRGSQKPYLPRRLKTARTTGSHQLQFGNPRTWPELSCPILLPWQGRQPGLGSTSHRSCCVLWQGGEWMGMVQSGPSFELLRCPTPQGPGLSLRVSPACGCHPCMYFLKNFSRKKTTTPEVEEEMGAEAKRL